MSKTKKIFLTILVSVSVIIGAIVSAVAVMVSPMVIYLIIVNWGYPDPPAPQIEYGEFPFELTYKIDGETVTIKDVYICEYDGIGANEGWGKYREWKGYIKGTNEELIFITEDSYRQIFCFVGDAEYYMNDEKYPEKRPLTPRLISVSKNPVGPFLLGEEIGEYYNIELVSWEFSEPIEQSFG